MSLLLRILYSTYRYNEFSFDNFYRLEKSMGSKRVPTKGLGYDSEIETDSDIWEIGSIGFE